MPKRPNVYIKTFIDKMDRCESWDGESVAYVYLGFKPWNEMFYVLSQCDPDWHFYSRRKHFKKWDVVAAGELHHDKYRKMGWVYYPCSTKVRPGFRGVGYGVMLYKALILAAIKHANITKSDCIFAPHLNVGGETSPSAMRVYESLVRKGYLKPAGRKAYTPGKIPKNFKPTFY